MEKHSVKKQRTKSKGTEKREMEGCTLVLAVLRELEKVIATGRARLFASWSVTLVLRSAQSGVIVLE